MFTAGLLVSEVGHPNGWIGVLDFATRSVRRLTADDQTALSTTVSRDSTMVVYAAFPDGDREQTALWKMPLDGGTPQQVVDRDVQYPQFLPHDESKILGLVNSNEHYQLEIVALPK